MRRSIAIASVVAALAFGFGACAATQEWNLGPAEEAPGAPADDGRVDPPSATTAQRRAPMVRTPVAR
jgi:hypothetical protein